MKYCPECGIALADEDHKRCPLCSAELANQVPESPPDALRQPETMLEEFTGSLRRKPWLVGAVSAAILFMPAVITLIVDLFINRSLTWSLTVVAAIILLWLYIGLPPLVFYRKDMELSDDERRRSRRSRFWILMLLDTLATLGFLVIIDAISGQAGLHWALQFGSLVCLATLGVVMLSFYTLQPPGAARRGWLLFIYVSGYIGCIDLMVTMFFQPEMYKGWSLIVAASLVPIGIVYLVIAKILQHSERARRRLHL